MPAKGPTAPLTAAIAAGDDEAFGAFYDAWFDAAFALARTVCRRDESFCLDVVQDVMLKVVRRMPALSTEAAVSAWMTRTVWSSAVDRLRRERRALRRETQAAVDRGTVDERDPLRLAQGREEIAWLHGRLAEMPAGDRQLVEARFLTGGSVTAAGRSLGLGADAAHGRLRRVVDRLRQAARDWIGT